MALERLIRVIRQTFDTDADISAATTPADIMGWDSFGHINLIVQVEEEFDLSFTNDEIGAIQSVGDLHKLLSSKLNS